MTRTIDLALGRCELGCPFCGDLRTPDAAIDKALEDAPSRVVLRGNPGPTSSALAALIRRLRDRGAVDVVVRTHALDAMHERDARALCAIGASAVLVPLFSSAPQVHDRITQRPGSLTASLVGMRSLADAGAAIEIEIPLLSQRLQDLEALVVLAHRAVPALRAVRFFVSRERVPAVLAAPSWADARPGLIAALRKCRALGVEARIGGADDIPLCVLRDEPYLHDAYRFHPKRKARLAEGASHPEVCRTCAVQRQCSGVSHTSREMYGDAGLLPYLRKPAAMYAQRTPGRPVFTVEHRRLAAKVGMLVLRPTVHCNQDCTFCSANETSNNVWEDPSAMLRTIVRAAQRGIRRVSFGGGEPTLARDLVQYVDAARRLGIETIEIVTNAVLLDREPRVSALRAAGLTHAFVSLHAHDEALSQMLTRKVGDHARTLKGLEHLVAAGVETVINHVVTSRNYPYLSRFVELVHARFGGRVMISIAFVTPQFKVLEDMSQVPRLTDVMPHLRHSLYRALELGQSVQVGSRQGIPPCFLEEFRAWSDVLGYAGEPAAEDAPQKQRAPGCDSCRYTDSCTGLWRPYVERHGLSELQPVPGGAFTDEERAQISAYVPGGRWATPLAFEGLPEPVRDREAEIRGRAGLTSSGAPRMPPARALPVLQANRSRPLRTLLVGTGRQARRLARDARTVAGLAIEAVASPHARDTELGDFDGCPSFSSMEEAVAEMRPEAVIIAASTDAHHALARAALAHGLPVLLEKPLARTLEDAEDLVRASSASGAVLMPAYQTIFASGLDTMFSARELSVLTYARRTTAGGPDSMRAWSRGALAETLHHVLALVGHAAGGGRPRVGVVFFRGERAPEQIRARLEYADAGGTIEADVELDFVAPADETVLTRRAPDTAERARVWRRAGPQTSLSIDGAEAAVQRDGNDVQRMLAHFRDLALGKAAPIVTPMAALDVLVSVRAVIAALEAVGAPFERQDAPRHASSPSLVAFPRVPR